MRPKRADISVRIEPTVDGGWRVIAKDVIRQGRMFGPLHELGYDSRHFPKWFRTREEAVEYAHVLKTNIDRRWHNLYEREAFEV